MSEVERLHLHRLIRAAVTFTAQRDLAFAPLREGTMLLLHGLDAPAMVLDQRGDVHAMNRLAELLLVGLHAASPDSANHTRWLFLDSSARHLLVEWEVVARSAVHVLREAAGRRPLDPMLHTLVGQLSVASPEFRSWWADHDVAARCHGIKRFRHPVVGELELYAEALELPDDGRWLYTYSPKPDSPSAHSLRLLESWAATDDATTAHDLLPVATANE